MFYQEAFTEQARACLKVDLEVLAVTVMASPEILNTGKVLAFMDGAGWCRRSRGHRRFFSWPVAILGTRFLPLGSRRFIAQRARELPQPMTLRFISIGSGAVAFDDLSDQVG